jgi:DNA replication protein DnaC
MLHHPTIQKLYELKLTGMAEALSEQQGHPEIGNLTFEERLGLLVDHETTVQDNRRLKTRLRKANLRQSASVEDINFRYPRGLDKALVLSLADCEWIRHHENVLITGSTGSGKSFLACALGHKACLEGFSVKYWRFSRLLEELSMSKCDGRYPKVLRDLAKTYVLIIDDWCLVPLGDENRRDLLEVLEDRYHLRSTIVTSQLPVKAWHEYLDDPTIADSILDRLVHNAYRIELTAKESIRKVEARKRKASSKRS